jgi:hypothetical protein
MDLEHEVLNGAGSPFLRKNRSVILDTEVSRTALILARPS